MPKYFNKDKNNDGQTLKEIETAESKSELIASLRSRGLFVISLEETGQEKKEVNIFSVIFSSRGKRNSLKTEDMALFARNLAVTLSSGITLLRSLELIADQTDSLKLDSTLRKCQQDIKNGLSFGEAAAKYPNVFPNLWTGVIRVGETSGNLPFVLDKLADYLEMRCEFERKIKSAMVYPGILMIVSVCALIFFFKFIFPKFKDIFKQFNIELPPLTLFLFAVSDFFESNLLVILGAIALAVFSFIVLRKNPAAKKSWDSFSLKIPYFGRMFFVTFLERMTSTVNILLESGLPLVYTIEVSAKSLGNFLLENKMLAIAKRVKDGHALSEEFKSQEVFPSLISEMIAIGEETGSMPEVFKKVSLHYRKELTSRIERFITAFEPLMIVVMGLAVGGIVISLFLPLFKISTIGSTM